VFYLPSHELGLHGMHLDPSVVLWDVPIVTRAARRMCHARCHLNNHVLPAIGTTKVQPVGARMRSTAVLVVVEP
jgi:hypothetical protein